MKKNSAHFSSDALQVMLATLLIIVGFYLVILNFAFPSEWVSYFFPLMMIFASWYWLAVYFLYHKEELFLPGLLFFVIGFFMILSLWKILPPLSFSWPLLVAGIGGALWVNLKNEGQSSMPLVLLTFTCIVLYLSQMSWFSLQTLMSFWPVLLVAVGMYMLFRTKKHKLSEYVEKKE